MRYLIVLIPFFILTNHPYAQGTYISENHSVQLRLKGTYELQENEQPLGKIMDFAIGEEGNIFVLDNQTASIIEYNKEGKANRCNYKKRTWAF